MEEDEVAATGVLRSSWHLYLHWEEAQYTRSHELLTGVAGRANLESSLA